MDRSSRTVSRCPICSFTEVTCDLVADGGPLWLGACPRCDHRWTARSGAPGMPPAVLARGPAGLARSPAVLARVPAPLRTGRVVAVA